MGKALAAHFLRKGHTVAIVGRNRTKGAAFMQLAEASGSAARAFFIEADVSLLSENRRVIDEVRSKCAVLDALIFCARHFRSTRAETAEGFEETFAAFYLSRFLLGEGLATLLERAENPVILNVAGPGVPGGTVNWDDLNLSQNYHGGLALEQGGRLNDLLGVGFALSHKDSKIKYVLMMPGLVSTSFSGQYDAATSTQIDAMKKAGKPIPDAIVPLISAIETPPSEPLSALMEGKPINLTGPAFDRQSAVRLRELTQKLVS